VHCTCPLSGVKRTSGWCTANERRFAAGDAARLDSGTASVYFPRMPRGSRDSHPRELLHVEHRAPAADVEKRLAERDRRLASDNRSEAERALGDPPFEQSALCQLRRMGRRK
jgi:hypothetical protein